MPVGLVGARDTRLLQLPTDRRINVTDHHVITERLVHETGELLVVLPVVVLKHMEGFVRCGLTQERKLVPCKRQADDAFYCLTLNDAEGLVGSRAFAHKLLEPGAVDVAGRTKTLTLSLLRLYVAAGLGCLFVFNQQTINELDLVVGSGRQKTSDLLCGHEGPIDLLGVEPSVVDGTDNGLSDLLAATLLDLIQTVVDDLCGALDRSIILLSRSLLSRSSLSLSGATRQFAHTGVSETRRPSAQRRGRGRRWRQRTAIKVRVHTLRSNRPTTLIKNKTLTLSRRRKWRGPWDRLCSRP